EKVDVEEVEFVTKELDLSLLRELNKEFGSLTYDVVTVLKTNVSKERLRYLKSFYAANYAIEKPSLKSFINKYVFHRQRLMLACLALFILIPTILLQRKPIMVVIDGNISTINTRHFNEDMLIDRIVDTYELSDYQVKEKESKILLFANQRIIFTTKKQITGQFKGEPYTYSTYTYTMEDFMKEFLKKQQPIDPKYEVIIQNVDQKNLKRVKISDGTQINIDLLSKEELISDVETDFAIENVDNPELPSGRITTIQEGQKQIERVYFEKVFINDVFMQERVVRKEVIQQGKNTIIERGTKVVAPSDSVWDQLAACETGGRWHANTGNGFYGGLQFSQPTWITAASHAGVSAAYAHEASKEDQIKAATWLQQNSGWGQWPACSLKLGLR
ncbi:MAG: resuscitation-promoting factor, partial [Bacilli bacterium]